MVSTPTGELLLLAQLAPGSFLLLFQALIGSTQLFFEGFVRQGVLQAVHPLRPVLHICLLSHRFWHTDRRETIIAVRMRY